MLLPPLPRQKSKHERGPSTNKRLLLTDKILFKNHLNFFLFIRTSIVLNNKNPVSLNKFHYNFPIFYRVIGPDNSSLL